MKKIIAPLLVIVVILSAMYYTLYEDEKVIEKMKIEINGAHVDKIGINHVTLNIHATFINMEGREIKGLSGKFTIFVLNQSIGNFSFNGVDIMPHSNKSINISINLYYEDVINAIIKAFKEGNAELYMKGYVEAKVMFGMLIYREYVVVKQQENI
ncbi:MAG: hypothetical protein J7K61_05250 [Thermoplasmata archaeon]|nr:hypothetical protein [Thermoplasmata archaeon]